MQWQGALLKVRADPPLEASMRYTAEPQKSDMRRNMLVLSKGRTRPVSFLHRVTARLVQHESQHMPCVYKRGHAGDLRIAPPGLARSHRLCGADLEKRLCALRASAPRGHCRRIWRPSWACGGDHSQDVQQRDRGGMHKTEAPKIYVGCAGMRFCLHRCSGVKAEPSSM